MRFPFMNESEACIIVNAGFSRTPFVFLLARQDRVTVFATTIDRVLAVRLERMSRFFFASGLISRHHTKSASYKIIVIWRTYYIGHITSVGKPRLWHKSVALSR